MRSANGQFFFILPILLCWVKFTAHFAAELLILLAAYFAQNSASKFCQGLSINSH